MAKFPQWEYDLLRALGIPGGYALTNSGMDTQYPNSLLALNLWAQSEGSVTNNPLATSGRGAGATTCVAQCGSSSPIYEYDTEADGVAQMAHFLQGSFYTKIVSALVGNAALDDIFTAINTSPWCKGCESGQYPTDLAAVVHGGSGSISGTVGVGSGGSAGSGGALTGVTPGKDPNAPGGGANDLSTCVISFPGFLFFSGPCILTKGGVKWLSGVAALVAGTALAAFGVAVLAAYGFDRSGAKAAVAKTAGALPTPIGRIVRAGGAGGSSGRASASRSSGSRQARTVGLGPSAEPPPPPDRDDKLFEEVQRQQGPIGPRGGNPTARRAAANARRGRSVPGAPRRQPSESERRRMEAARRARAEQPF